MNSTPNASNATNLSLESIPNFVGQNFRTELEKTILLYFFWFILTIWFNSSVVSQVGSETSFTFFLVGSFTTVVATILSVLLREKELFHVISFCSVLVLNIVTFYCFHKSTTVVTINILLYLVLIQITPAILDIWSWKIQSACSAVVFLNATIFGLQFGFGETLQSIVLVIVSSFCSIAVVFLKSKNRDLKLEKDIKSGSEIISEINLKKIPNRFWGIVLLQAGLVVVLINLDIYLFGNTGGFDVKFKYYILFYVILSSCIFLVLKSDQLENYLLFQTVVIGALVSFTVTRSAEYNLLYVILPVVFLTYFTASLFWIVIKQVFVTWIVVLNHIIIRYFSSFQTKGVDSSYDVFFAAFKDELTFISLLSSLSVLIVFLVRGNYVSNLYYLNYIDNLDLDFLNKKSKNFKSVGLSYKFNSKFQKVFFSEKNRYLINGLFLFGFISSLGSSLFLVNNNFSIYISLLVSFGPYFFLWYLTYFVESKSKNNEQIWFLGSFTALVGIAQSSVVILKYGELGPIVFFWPIALVVVIKTIPWSLQELIFITLVSGVFGVKIVQLFFSGALGIISILCFVFICLMMSLRKSIKIKEFIISKYYTSAINSSKNSKELLLTFTDYLMSFI